ncbi:MarR family winged helix-turn-helix transcriptional regulator [Marmoricola endophyticus]|uniref:MarR family winged helix-turn-helix transcriptional regulator n=1 Tax=Marmoricola endophyticus TaxID=2040280 RepID=UPI0016653E7A|nr:MarR family transcriptional regulator [Marmoricola endophyticus]
MSNPTSTALAGVLRELAVTVVRDAPQHELSRTGAATLSRIRRGGPHRITALAELEAVSQPSMTGLVQRLEQLGYLTRSVDPADRRASLVAITPAGEQAVEARRHLHEQVIVDRLARLTPTHVEQLVAALPALTTLAETTEKPAHV